jgi:hypothetical protein|tara:strand:+ start:545 stop:955 length:411 start_codon:yes stop_codon:yes gene_type:complete
MATLKTNTLTGTSTAGSIAVTGEGNSTTTNLQQGLAKAWVNYNQSTPATVDSFSISSVTDSTTGEFKINISSAFSNTGYSSTGMTNGTAGVSRGIISEDHDNSRTTSQLPVITSKDSDGGYTDFTSSSVSMDGDLA